MPNCYGECYGEVKWFSRLHGYGFISDENGNDVFVHYSGLNMEGYKALRRGEKVRYEVSPEKKRKAINVSVVA